MSCSAQFAAPEHLNQVPQGLTTDVINPQNPSLQALSAVYFGKHRRDRGIYDRGMRLYSRAMSHLRQALQNPEQVSAIDTLVSTVCLCLLENVVFSAPLAWLRHYEGVAQLVGLFICSDG